MTPTTNLAADEGRESCDAAASAADRAALEIDSAPASAERFHIMDLAHWIDLSA